MKTLVSLGDPSLVMGSDRLRRLLLSALESFDGVRRVLIVPPDFTRHHSGAGEITGEAYRYADLEAMMDHYGPARLSPGHNMLPDGEEVFFVLDPGAGLWSLRSRFQTGRER